ncbi:hypothetical protein RHODGE_RHODGE_00871 [Rhodoplanes serenus]|uniref:Fungal lipase-type domain-containing protein n=1 Tax=Rhodoplanes serenus TaxID=200615 RepID=A0A447CR21_9BRAD|nr:lipase family protein [Rhodoplanes serenus]VCU07666.1 hypothetical protein RHODGE_RHODGE_00871 [Rhodoplanes serenus]
MTSRSHVDRSDDARDARPMTFLVRLPIELYPADALAGLLHEAEPPAPPGPCDLGAARAAVWAAQLAYEDELDKIDTVVSGWGARRLVRFDAPASPLLPITGTRGLLLATGDARILAFAGTDPLNLAHWLTDFDIVQTPEGIHRGFDAALDAVWGAVAMALSEHAGDARLLITGHSLGGALSVLAAQRLLITFGLRPQVWTFGMPRVGGPHFAERYEAALGAHTVRLVHGEDIVPTVPPSRLGYGHVGRRLTCARHTRFDAAALCGEPDDEPAFVPALIGGVKEGLRQLWSLSLAPEIRPDPIGQLSRVLPPAFGDHLPDRYWMALAPPS